MVSYVNKEYVQVADYAVLVAIALGSTVLVDTSSEMHQV
jgi:hypothetical protein